MTIVKFSEELLIPAEDVYWWRAMHDAPRLVDSRGHAMGDAATHMQRICEGHHKWAFCIQIDIHPDGSGCVWLYAQTKKQAAPQQAAELVQLYFQECHKPRGQTASVFTLGWASYNKQFHPSEFGGGAFVVTADRFHSATTWDYIQEKLERIENEAKEKACTLSAQSDNLPTSMSPVRNLRGRGSRKR